MSELLIYLDGKFVPKAEAKVSVYDHGFLYGDGVFEGIRAYNGRVFKLKEHVDRLYDSAKAIAMDIPVTKEEMTEIILETLRKNNLKDAYIRPIVSRGIGDLGLDPASVKSRASSLLPRAGEPCTATFTKSDSQESVSVSAEMRQMHFPRTSSP